MKDSDNLPFTAIFTPTLAGGVGKIVSTLSLGMSQKNMKVEIWTIAGGEYEKTLTADITVRKLGSTDRLRSAFWPLVHLIKTNPPTALLSISFHCNCAVILARFLSHRRFRLIISEHTSLLSGFTYMTFTSRNIARICIKLLYRFADGWVAVSKDSGKSMAKTAGLVEKKVRVIYNPVLTNKLYEDSDKLIEPPFPEYEGNIILYVGRLSPEKDLETLLYAAKNLYQDIDARLLIIGDGPERSNLEKSADSLGISAKTKFIGHIKNPYPYFKYSDVLVLSSLREGLPTVLIEALALELPVISTDCPSGPREILKDGEYGKLVPIKDPSALAKAILNTLTQSSTTTVPKSALKPYQADTAIEAYMEILRSPQT